MVNDNIFLENGYLNFQAIVDKGCVFNLIIGGRGTGKTFSSLKWEIENDRNFIFLRKNQVQLDMVTKPGFSPFEPLNYELGFNVEVKARGQKMAVVTHNNLEIGYMLALSAISGIRGFDASSVEDLIYDEFIHELHEKPMKGEFEAFANAYETINRNRELNGRDPVRCYLLANSNSLESDILLGLNLVETLRRMRKKGKQTYIDSKRSILVVDLFSSPISRAKKNTALYRLTAGSDFASMALDNEFSHDNTDKIKSMPLNEYILEVEVGELYFYRHKSRREYYISFQKRGSGKEYIEPMGEGKKRLNRQYGKYYTAHVNNKILFENMTAKILFEKYFST